MRNIALAGNPNTGKTTLFNVLTGARAHVGNYPGITVERHEGVHVCGDGQRWQLHDLPGSYSLSAHSPEEEIAHHALTGRTVQGAMDLAIVVLDASNLARNLFLLLQVAELGIPVVGALNMIDAAEALGLQIDVPRLSQAIGCPLVPMVARAGRGVTELEQAVAQVLANPGQFRIVDTQWPAAVRQAIEAVKPTLTSRLLLETGASDGEALWWLAANADLADAQVPGLGQTLQALVPRSGDGPDVRRQATEARYARIDSWIQAYYQRAVQKNGTPSDRIDRVVLHPWLGAVLFLGAMALLFQAVFLGAQPAMNAVDWLMSAVADWAKSQLPDSLLRQVLVDGVLAGVAATLVFLPQILILFLGIAILEDSGYLARTAFVVDRLMARVGLPGKAFVPLLSSFACAVPGIMATRTMTDKRDRLLTILVAPLMSCSARLPVYTLVTAAVFAHQAPLFGLVAPGGLVVAGMYILGFVVALLSAYVLRRTAVRGGGAPLLLEMPPWRWPRPGNIVQALWDRARVFVVQTGSVIVALSVVLWALMSFPNNGLEPIEKAKLIQEVERSTLADSPQRAKGLQVVDQRDAQARLANSVAGRLGKLVEPVIAPLGFDWRIGIGLIGAFAAREVLVPTLGQVYGQGRADVDDVYVGRVARELAESGGLTPLKGLSLMVFFAIAMQCLSTVATIRRETNSWSWAIMVLVYLNGLAWLASLAVYQGGRALGFA